MMVVIFGKVMDWWPSVAKMQMHDRWRHDAGRAA
jgi:hypothetical protein